MENKFLAKTKPKVETIMEHTDNLIAQYNKIKQIYPDIKYVKWDMLYLSCLYHDLGKINSKFQNKLMGKLDETEKLEDVLPGKDEIPHGYLSVAFLPFEKLEKEYTQDEIRILCQSIFYHHNREKLEKFEPIETMIEKDLDRYWKEIDYDILPKIEKLDYTYSRYTTTGRIPDNHDTDETFYKYVMNKGLLNKIDYAASSYVDVEVEHDNLFEKTLEFLDKGGYKPNELQEYLIRNSEENNVIIASTGIGKTEGALFWIGNNKGFFTLPLKVSINAIYDRITQKIGHEIKKIGLLHSSTSSEYLKRSEGELDLVYYEKTKQLSLPLTICTLDQLIDFIFKYEGFELKLATLAYSKLIIDEIQMYSPELVAYLIVALKYITAIKGKFTILTATLPPVFEHFMKKMNIKYKTPEKPFLKKVNGKVQVRHKIKVLSEDINMRHILTNYKNKKVLIIANTVKQAQKLYSDLKEALPDVNINMLHGKFIGRDRKIKEDDILDMGSSGSKETGIWVATQVVEASLDIDFDVLYTELSDISGLLQRLGRVFRNRDLIEKYINIYVFIGASRRPSGITTSEKSLIDFEIFDLSKQEILKYDNQILDEETKMSIVKSVYSVKNLEDTRYFNKILKYINATKNIKAYEYNKGDIDLRNINTIAVIPKSLFKENKEYIAEKIGIIKDKENYKFSDRLAAKESIKELTVIIQEEEFARAKKQGFVLTNKIVVDDYTEIPIISFDYSFEKGLERPTDVKNFDEDEQFL